MRWWMSVACVAIWVCGCGTYRNTINGPRPRAGMSPAQVQQLMGYSLDKVGGSRWEVWRYGVNIFGLVGNACHASDMYCIEVQFIDGRVHDVVSYGR